MSTPHLTIQYYEFYLEDLEEGFNFVVQFIHSVFIEKDVLHLCDYKAPFFRSWSPFLKLAKLYQHTFIFKVESSLS